MNAYARNSSVILVGGVWCSFDEDACPRLTITALSICSLGKTVVNTEALIL